MSYQFLTNFLPVSCTNKVWSFPRRLRYQRLHTFASCQFQTGLLLSCQFHVSLLSISYQFPISFLSVWYISFLSVFYQSPINFISVSHQFPISFLSVFYQLPISFLSVSYQFPDSGIASPWRASPQLELSFGFEFEGSGFRAKGACSRVQDLEFAECCENESGGEGVYLTESVDKVVLQKSIPAQIRQLFLSISNDKGQVDELMQESTFTKRHAKKLQRDKFTAERVAAGSSFPGVRPVQPPPPSGVLLESGALMKFS